MSHFSYADSTRESTITNSQLSSRSSVKRKRSDLESNPSLSKKSKGKGKGKGRADPHASARQILTGMEDSVSCSICYHLFSEPHVATPCGHSFCGECIVGWIKQSIRTQPRCPVCRTALTQGSLIIPNFALKHSIEKHVGALAETGVVDWQPQGQRYLEWTQRNL
ncbi:hypothetical protein C8Q80DRAFT_89067 [Daedaleopsis nitida]|nr:hypothetical protein C8Q80DRAFT_89067 [Daedaleopsis nitida]